MFILFIDGELHPMKPTEKDTIGDIPFEWGTEGREEVRVDGKGNSRMASS